MRIESGSSRTEQLPSYHHSSLSHSGYINNSILGIHNMAPKRKIASAAPRRIAARRLVRRRRTRKQGNSSNVSWASLIVKGVNTLLSVVPGAKIFAPVADFAFKSLGFTTAQLNINGNVVSGTTYVFGSSAAFFIPLSTLIQDSPSLVRANRDDNIAQKDIITGYSHGQLLQIRVTARPIGQLAYRQGNWALAYIPFASSESQKFYEDNVTVPTLRDVLCIPGAVQGPGTRPLSTNYRARRNTYDALTHPLQTYIGMVMICYEDLSRNKGSEFGPEDFGAELIVSGVVRLANPIPHAGWSQIDCRVKDNLKGVSVRVNQHVLTDARMEPSGDALQFTGTMVQPSRTFISPFDVFGHVEKLDATTSSPSFRSPPSDIELRLREASLDA